ncbi:MAG TPA: hypothetical protein VMY87_06290 [Armatimonadota bacterium]|nr:hypothetical protein [Armatimonadota bacterium]
MTFHIKEDLPRPLEYAPTQDLVEELMTRGDAVVVVVARLDILPGVNALKRRWHGNMSKCIDQCQAIIDEVSELLAEEDLRHDDEGADSELTT